MKRNYLFVATLGMAMLALTACDPKNTPEEPNPQDTTDVPVDTTVVPVDTTDVPTDTIIPASFPKKHLIEEFTGQDCGYCPGGMDDIHEFMGNDTNWVLILHHYGYQADHFSVSGSKTITSKLGVSGAPSSAINRAKTKTGAGNKIVFHPAYLPDCDKSQFDTETYASIQIQNTFDAASRELKVNVSGLLAKEDAPQLFLTVLVKESGMVDYQADYYGSYEGWQEFRHCNAVRVFLTASTGDSVHVNGQRYQAEFTTTLKDAWVPENCMVVAFLTEAFKPVVQAEQRPVVAGTTGGADILHGGITPVPVSDYYPEPDPTKGPADYSGHTDGETIKDQSYAFYTSYPSYGFNYWTIYGYNTTGAFTVEGTKSVAFANIHVFTDLETTSLPEGDYVFSTSMEPGTAWAGYRDDANYDIGGSEFYFTNYSYLTQNYLVPVTTWLIADGTLTIGKSSWSVTGHARNGADIILLGTKAITNQGQSNAPQRIQPRRNTNPLQKYIPALNYCKQ